MGTKVNVPPAPAKSETELALEQEQLELLREQRAETKKFQPYLYESMGLRETPEGEIEKIDTGKTPEEIYAEAGLRRLGYSPTGEKLTEEEITAGLSPSEQREYSIYKQLQERQTKALAGELDISPALEAQLTEQEQQLATQLSQKLGPNWRESTPGIQAMSEFQKRAELLREEARRGQITTGEAMLEARLGGEQRAQQQAMGGTQLYAGLTGQKIGQYATIPTRTSGLVSQYMQAKQPYQQERMSMYDLQTSAAMQSAANRAALYGSLISAGGTLGGASVLKWSSKELKKNIEPIMSAIEKVEAINGVVFDWKQNDIHDIGVIAEEVEKICPEAIDEIEGIKAVYYYKLIPILIEAIKAQQKQINALTEA